MLLRDITEGERFELAVLNPTGVFGPVLCGVPGTTAKVNKKLIVKFRTMGSRLRMSQSSVTPNIDGKQTLSIEITNIRISVAP